MRVDGAHVEALDQLAAAAGVTLGRGAPGVRVLAPALDTDPHEVEAARRRLVAHGAALAVGRGAP